MSNGASPLEALLPVIDIPSDAEDDAMMELAIALSLQDNEAGDLQSLQQGLQDLQGLQGLQNLSSQALQVQPNIKGFTSLIKSKCT